MEINNCSRVLNVWPDPRLCIGTRYRALLPLTIPSLLPHFSPHIHLLTGSVKRPILSAINGSSIDNHPGGRHRFLLSPKISLELLLDSFFATVSWAIYSLNAPFQVWLGRFRLLAAFAEYPWIGAAVVDPVEQDPLVFLTGPTKGLSRVFYSPQLMPWKIRAPLSSSSSAATI